MKASLKNPVVVGVDGSEQSLRAVRFAAETAQRLGCGLRVVHSLPEVVPMAPVLPLTSADTFEAIAHRLVNEARKVADAVTGGAIEVETLIRFGARVHSLVLAGEDARLIVLGHRDRSRVGRVFSASTCTGVATRAHCPVVSVPASWAPGAQHGCVVVGVDDAAHSHEALVSAFAVAASSGSRLRILHAWKLRSPYDEIVANMDDDEWKAEVTAQVEEAVAGLRADHREVEVEIDVRHQDPTTALLEAAEEADLLVLGRRGHGAPLGFYLGSVARTLIREATCPVEITPLRPRHGDQPTADDELLADELSPQT